MISIIAGCTAGIVLAIAALAVWDWRLPSRGRGGFPY